MRINVVKQAKLWWFISSGVIIASIAAMAISWTTIDAPLRPSLDFVGGTKLQLTLDCSIEGNCDQPLTTAEVQAILDEQAIGKSSVQIVDDYTLSVRTPNLDVNQRTALQTTISKEIGAFDPQTISIDTVGPTIGKQLFVSGMLALGASMAGIIIYLTLRFQFDYAIFAILALFHDTIATMGVFSILGLVAGVEVDSLFLVALLTIIGFSVNDTVVIYDRIRENFLAHPNDPVDGIINDSVNQTLTRSINTSLTTILPLIAIFLFGGATLKYFALALIIGFIFGAYSSIFVASTMLGAWRKRNYKVNAPVAIEES
jgi:preprotein translocase subunit SecF